jgi:hypothetical protein
MFTSSDKRNETMRIMGEHNVVTERKKDEAVSVTNSVGRVGHAVVELEPLGGISRNSYGR